MDEFVLMLAYPDRWSGMKNQVNWLIIRLEWRDWQADMMMGVWLMCLECMVLIDQRYSSRHMVLDFPTVAR